jgi:hypothetical protein
MATPPFEADPFCGRGQIEIGINARQLATLRLRDK